MNSGVYCLTSPSGKRYVGCSSNITLRWNRYKKLFCENQVKLYNALKKYGPENFKYEVVLETDDMDNAYRSEMYLIDVWNLQNDDYGYNITAGGRGNKKECSFITKKAIGEANRKNPTRYWLGKRRDVETNKKISATKTGVRNKKSLKSFIIEKDGVQQIVDDLKEFCIKNNIKYQSALSVSCGARNSVYGFKIAPTMINTNI